MGRIEAYNCICQNCEEVFILNKYMINVINLDDGSDDTLKFLSCSLNNVTCPYCCVNFTYEIPMLIFSNNHKFAIKVSPKEILYKSNEVCFIPNFIYDTGFKYREVNFFIEGLEKARIISDGLDDKYVEYLKYKLFKDDDAIPFYDVSLVYKSSDSCSIYFEKLDSNNNLLNEYTITKDSFNKFGKTKFAPDIPKIWNVINRYTINEYIEKEF